MIVVITGGTGFIGKALVRRLLAKGHTPVILTSGHNSSFVNDLTSEVKVIQYKLLMGDATVSAIKAMNPDIFVHLAWRGVKGGDRNASYQIRENIELTLSSVELSAKVGCKRWIGAGSQAEYGNPNCKVNENFVTNPTTLYGKSKLSCCWATQGLCEVLGLQYTWLRIFSTYGIYEAPEWFIPYIISELKSGKSPKLTKCEQMWDFLYVDDAADAIIQVFEKEANGIYNLGSGNIISLRKVVEIIREELNSTVSIDFGAVPYRSDQVMHLEADVSRLVKASGWFPKVEIKEGIRRSIDSWGK